jgi:hypothetical protein
MKRALALLCFLSSLNAVSTVAAQEFYPDFALVVQLPSYETFLRNISSSPIRVDRYRITSESNSLSPSGWASLDSAGPEIVDALGPGADQFETVGAIDSSLLSELNLLGSGTWQPGQSWSIGFPFNSDDPNFVFDAEFEVSSPDGLVLSGGTIVLDGVLAPAVVLIVPEPTSGALLVLAAAGTLALRAGRCRGRGRAAC